MKTLSVLVFGLFIGISPVISQTAESVKDEGKTQLTKGVYTDANKDGVCDNYTGYHNNSNTSGFVDKDKDGICDNHNTNGFGNGYGHRNGHYHGNLNYCGHGHGSGHGHGNGYGRRFWKSKE